MQYYPENSFRSDVRYFRKYTDLKKKTKKTEKRERKKKIKHHGIWTQDPRLNDQESSALMIPLTGIMKR